MAGALHLRRIQSPEILYKEDDSEIADTLGIGFCFCLKSFAHSILVFFNSTKSHLEYTQAITTVMAADPSEAGP